MTASLGWPCEKTILPLGYVVTRRAAPADVKKASASKAGGFARTWGRRAFGIGGPIISCDAGQTPCRFLDARSKRRGRAAPERRFRIALVAQWSTYVICCVQACSQLKTSIVLSVFAIGLKATFAEATFDVGCDTVSPVSDLYQSPFAFTGTILRVVVDIIEASFEDPAAQHEMRAPLAMATQ